MSTCFFGNNRDDFLKNLPCSYIKILFLEICFFLGLNYVSISMSINLKKEFQICFAP